MPPRTPRLAHPHHRVTAVVVAHDGAAWLPETLDALARQARPVQWVVAADTGSTDGCADLLAARYGSERVVVLPKETGFGTAVAAALARADELLATDPPPPLPRRRAADAGAPIEPVHWVWLLHDDCAPEPDALRALLDAATDAPSAAVLGPKARDWDDPRLLVEVGLTIDRAGRRETGLERREFDQGQHDTQRDVLAVGSAGCLIRRDVWDALGGFDPRLPLFRDDIDFGWRANAAGHRVLAVPNATVRHARAAWTGRRHHDATPGRLHGVDRRHSIATLLANLPPTALAAALPRLAVGALLRTLAFLLTRQVADARDEVRAVLWNLAHLGDLARARRARAATRTVPYRALGPLFAGRAARLRGYLDAGVAWATGAGGSAGLGEENEDDQLVERPRRRLRDVLAARPGLPLVLALVAVTLVAVRGLVGGGSLVGGVLLPPPDGAADYWREFAGSWHRAGTGSDAAASPALALLGAVAGLLGGKGWLAVDVLLLGCVPLAGIAAWFASRRVTGILGLRLWASVAYAFVPVATGAIAEGRLDAAVAFAAMPLVVAGGHRVLTSDPRYAGWRTPFAVGLGVAPVVAFAPQVWPLYAAPLAAGGLVLLLTATPASRAGAVRRMTSIVLASVTPLAVLVPWSLRLLDEPGVLLAGPRILGDPGVTGRVEGWDLLLLRPGGPAQPPCWVLAGLVAAALAGLVRRHRARVTLGAWALALGGYLTALAVVRGAGDLDPAYPGPALALVACALLVSAVVAAEGARETLARRDFGWRQPTAVLVAIAAAVGPLVAAGAWVGRGAAGPLDRRPTAVLPAVAVAEARANAGARVLWLDRPGRSPTEPVRYALTPATGSRLTDSWAGDDPDTRRLLDGLVADLTSPRGTSASDALSAFAVRFVAVPEPVEPALASALDAQGGLSRVAYVGPVQLWRTLTPSSRLTLLQPELANGARQGQFNRREDLRAIPPIPLAARGESASATVSAGRSGRLVVLSERRDADWVATLDGRPLEPVTAYGWAQAFELPETGGLVEVRRDTGPRRRALALEGALLLLAVVLAAPSIRRSDDGPVEEEDMVAVAEEERTLEPVP